MAGSLEERIAVQDVMQRYAAGVDDRDMALYRSCFADDVEVVGFAARVIRGADAWMDHVQSALAQFGPTQHMLSPVLADIDGDLAHCRTDVQAFHCLKDAGDDTLTLWATYLTDMRRTASGWKIVRHELVSRAIRNSGT